MMRLLSAAAVTLVLAGCSGAQQANEQYNDVASGVRLMRQTPIGRGTPVERVTALTDCSSTLLTAVAQTPPPPRADRMRTEAERLLRLAVQLGERNGQTGANITRARDEAVASNRQLSERLPQEFPGMLTQAVSACATSEVMTDQELTG